VGVIAVGFVDVISQLVLVAGLFLTGSGLYIVVSIFLIPAIF
jgi:hypothetical protein